MKKKNDDTKNELLAKMKKAVKLDFDALALQESIEQRLKEQPVLTEAELEELKEKADAFGHEAAEKGCWIGLGSFRVEGKENPIALVQAAGSVSTLALMVAEAMVHQPGLEKAILLAVGLKMKFGDMEDAAEDDDMTDAAEAAEDGQAPGCELGEC